MSKPEGIDWNPIGTVDVTFDGTTYHLGRPKMRQFKWFTERLTEATRTVSDELARIQREIAAAQAKHEDEETPEAKAEIDRLTAEVREFNGRPFYEATAAITREMFEQLGDSLPDDLNDWPVWLAADASIPGEILKHWRTNPKASGPTPPI